MFIKCFELYILIIKIIKSYIHVNKEKLINVFYFFYGEIHYKIAFLYNNFLDFIA